MAFTEYQLKAIKSYDKPTMVLATAGSGKTLVLTERIKYGIKEFGINSENILAITFTNKATEEMRRRLFEHGKVNIFTIHALCCEILREDIHLLHMGYNEDFNIIDTYDCLDILKMVMGANNIRSNLSFRRIMDDISNYINLATEPNFEVQQIMKLYFEYLQKFNLVTFDTMLLLTNELLKDMFCKMKYQFKYRYISVDEFQDVNLIQYQIIKNLAIDDKNIFVVGDDDQSIYSFRGSYKKIFEDFKNDFQPVEIHLEKNWRSNDKICNFASRLINFNINRIEKKVYSDYVFNGSPITVNEFKKSEDEVKFVIEKVKESIEQFKKTHFRKNNIPFAVLYRNNFVSKDFEVALMKENIKYKILGGIPFVKRKEIQDIISYLKLILDNNSFIDFKRICNNPPRGIGDTTIKKIHNNIMDLDVNLQSCIDSSFMFLSKNSFEALITFNDVIKDLSEKFDDYLISDLIDIILSKFHYMDVIKGDEEKNINILWFKQLMKELDLNIKMHDLDKREVLRDYLDHSFLDDGTDQNSDDVYLLLSTIHSVKGMEFDEVFLVSFEDEFCPFTYGRTLSLDDLEEERRIAFVGITRARYKLNISYCKSRMYFGKFVQCQESRFIDEAIF